MKCRSNFNKANVQFSQVLNLVEKLYQKFRAFEKNALIAPLPKTNTKKSGCPSPRYITMSTNTTLGLMSQFHGGSFPSQVYPYLLNIGLIKCKA